MASRLPRFALAAAGLAALAATAPAAAEHMRFWRQTSYEEFDKGTAKGVALRSDGRLVPAPRFAPLGDPNLAYLWALRADSKGNIYAAGGSPAKVLRLDAKGVPASVFEATELAAQALAVDQSDNLYVGTSPDGKVYRITPKGERSVYFDPQRKYIWDLAFDRAGTLYVATGDKGEIFAVAPGGQGRLLFKTEETHVRSLAVDPAGRLFAGTEPSGLILRINLGEALGEKSDTPRAFVVYEAQKKEVTALITDAQGSLYAAAVGDKSQTVPVVAPVISPPAIQTQPGVVVSPPMAIPQAAFLPFPPLGGGSDVYRFSPDGAPERLWSSRDELVYSLALTPAGSLLLGTGSRGVVYQLEGDSVYANIAKTSAGQVTCFAIGPGGKTLLGTANPGKIFTLGPGLEPDGSYESQVFDAKLFSSWGRLTWWGDDGSGDGHLAFYLRSGNTSDPNKYWSPWAGPFRASGGDAVSLPPGRFVQWKAVFRGVPGPGTNISWVNLAYLPRNVAPAIDAIVLQNPGIRVQSMAAGVMPPGQAQPVQLRMPPPPPTPGVTVFPQPAPAQPTRFEAPPQGYAQKGWQSVLWGAHDDNDDDLTYTIYFRGEGEKAWRLLKDRVDSKYCSWDTSSLPDGAYYLKIVASDAPSNPLDEALTASRESDRFEVDNTPPDILNLQAAVMGNSAQVHFDARDPASVLGRADWSLDGGDWRMVLPAGRLSDARQESYAFTLRDLAPGEHTVAVRVSDQFDNQAAAKTTFSIVAPGKK